MLRLTEIKLPIEHDEESLLAAILRRLNIPRKFLLRHAIFKRGVDARRPGPISFIYTIDVEVSDEAKTLKQQKNQRNITPSPDMSYRMVAKATGKENRRPVVIGTGPCGIFAGLILAQMGFRPIILERGKAVRERTKDTFGLWRNNILNPESNVQFGEGGAGTFSDGKLYSQIKDPKFYGRKVIQEFIAAGAPPEILYVSKPHIGTFKLVGIVEHMRATIESLGGEIRFTSKVVDIELAHSPRLAGGDLSMDPNGAQFSTLADPGQGRGYMQVRSVSLASGEKIETNHVVLAVGHSARDTFEMLHSRGIHIEAKPLSIGVRIEHPQSMIDRCRLREAAGHPLLGAADYKLVHHCKNDRSAYSFCMCPGGTVVAATSEVGRVVTNGMSQYSRNERNANAGLVVGITPEVDYPDGPLAGIAFQRHWESKAFEAGGSNYDAPAQLVGDFLAGRASTKLGDIQPSYTPGVKLTDLSLCLPDFVVTAMREAIVAMDKQMRGFARPDAVMTGVETRTSSPIRITRDESYQSLNTKGLFPAGEGAGYAGGILSAGVDGIKVAEAVAQAMVNDRR